VIINILFVNVRQSEYWQMPKGKTQAKFGFGLGFSLGFGLGFSLNFSLSFGSSFNRDFIRSS